MKKEKNFMFKLAKFIVDKRRAVYFIFILAIVFSVLSIPKVKVNNDITSYLPADTETRRGLNIMEDQFVTYDTAKVEVCNITYKEGEKIQKQLEGLDGIKKVEYDDTDDHFKNSSALFDVTVERNLSDEDELDLLDTVKSELSAYDCYVYSSTIDDSSRQLEKEMTMILICAVIVIVGVLLFTSESFMEVPIFFMVFASAAALNMGTNYLLGEISFITKAIAVVLQLALAIDYSIILAHRFTEEKNKGLPAYDAIIEALSKAIVEISSSSLTTISGLAALCVMQFKIGMDMGVVLCKGILFSLVAVFFLMPGLLLLFSNSIDRTRHKSFVPKISLWGRFVMKSRYVGPIAFAVIAVLCIFFSSNCDYAFDMSSIKASRESEKTVSENRIKETFGADNQLAVIIPKGDYIKEGKILDTVSKMDGITSALGLANVEVEDGYMLTDKVTPREFSEISGIDLDMARLLFQAYGASNEQYGAIFQNVDNYTVTIIDIFMFVYEQMDLGVISLDDEMTDKVNDLHDELTEAREQLEGDKYSRLIFTYSYDIESDKSKELIDDVRKLSEKYYGEVIMASNSTNSFDLKSTFGGDNSKISLITFLAVTIILLFTFQSSGLPLMLVLTIQGSVWINFSVPYLTHSKMYFLSYLVVSSIQMGATIDYAIVMTNRYVSLRERTDHRKAIIISINQAFPTILTSGSILTIAGFLIGFISTNPIIASIGMTLGRGTLTSILLVMLVLPQILLLGDKIIDKTAFAKKDRGTNIDKGIVYANGRVRGYVSGFVDGTFHGVIRGSVNASVETGEPGGNTQQKMLPDGTHTANAEE